jgi:hypothetical protein
VVSCSRTIGQSIQIQDVMGSRGYVGLALLLVLVTSSPIPSERAKVRLRPRSPRLRGDDLVPIQASYFSTGGFGAEGA